MSSIIQEQIRTGACTLYHDYRSGSLRDLSGNGNDGVGTNHSLSPDGLRPTYLTSGYVTVADCTLFDANKYGTIFVLVKNQGTVERALTDYVTDAGGQCRFLFSYSGDDAVYYLADGTYTRFSNLFSAPLVQSHCVVFENSQLSLFYQDGSYFDDGNNTNVFGSLSGNGDFIIGSNASHSQHANSVIQAVFVTKTKLTAGEISQLHTELSSLKWPSKPISKVYDLSVTPPTMTKAFFDRGLIASGKTFSSGFIENSGLKIISGSYSVSDDGNGRSLDCVTDGVAQIDTSNFGVTPVQSAYGRWDFWVHKDDADTIKIAFVESTFTPLTTGYHLELDASENIKIVETGGATIVTGSTSLTADTWEHLTVTRESADGTFTLYLNDASIGSAADITVTSSRLVGIDIDAGSQLGLTGDYVMQYSPIVSAP